MPTPADPREQLFIQALHDARPLVLEWLRVQQRIVRMNDVRRVADVPEQTSKETVDEACAAEDALVRLLAEGNAAARAVLDTLAHHLTSDLCEEEVPTLAFTPEFDRVLATGMHAFERFTARDGEGVVS